MHKCAHTHTHIKDSRKAAGQNSVIKMMLSTKEISMQLTPAEYIQENKKPKHQKRKHGITTTKC